MWSGPRRQGRQCICGTSIMHHIITCLGRQAPPPFLQRPRPLHAARPTRTYASRSAFTTSSPSRLHGLWGHRWRCQAGRACMCHDCMPDVCMCGTVRLAVGADAQPRLPYACMYRRVSHGWDDVRFVTCPGVRCPASQWLRDQMRTAAVALPGPAGLHTLSAAAGACFSCHGVAYLYIRVPAWDEALLSL